VEVYLSSGTDVDDLAVRNMLVFYLNELARWDPGLVMNDAGLPVWADFGLPGPRTGPECALHNWWIRGDCERLVFRRDGAAVGFAVIASPPTHLDESFDHEVVDFYVSPKARGQGVGLAAARQILSIRPGSWVLFTLAGNTAAKAFWRRALAESRVRDVEERDDATEFRFRV
jgi:predicted acetyltransferase